MLRRLLRALIVAGIRFVARHPALRAVTRAVLPLVPALHPLVRRFLPQPVVVAPPTVADVEAMLVFDRARAVPGPGGAVTVEQLCQLARAG